MMARVLIGYSCCPLTAAAFAAQGHGVWTCDLLASRGWHQHLQMDIWEAIEKHGPWDFGVFHPMCTYLTCSAAWAFRDPDFAKYPAGGYHQNLKAGTLTGHARRQARDLDLGNFQRLISLQFPAAIENPATSFVNKAIRRPDQVIQPYQFGDNASKATGLWLSHGTPPLRETAVVAPRIVRGLARWSNQTDSGQNRLSPSADRWLERSKTFPGIAAAMGDQWGKWLNGRAD